MMLSGHLSAFIIFIAGSVSIISIALFCLFIGLREGNYYFNNWTISTNLNFSSQFQLNACVTHQEKREAIYIYQPINNPSHPSSFFRKRESGWLTKLTPGSISLDEKEGSYGNKIWASGRHRVSILVVAQEAKNNYILCDSPIENDKILFLKGISDCLILMRENNLYISPLSINTTKNLSSAQSKDLIALIMNNGFILGWPFSITKNFSTNMPTAFKLLFILGLEASFLYLGIALYLILKRGKMITTKIYPLNTSIKNTQIISLTSTGQENKSLPRIIIRGVDDVGEGNGCNPVIGNRQYYSQQSEVDDARGEDDYGNTIFFPLTEDNEKSDNNKISIRYSNSCSNLILIPKDSSPLELFLENISHCFIIIKNEHEIIVRETGAKTSLSKDLKSFGRQITKTIANLGSDFFQP